MGTLTNYWWNIKVFNMDQDQSGVTITDFFNGLLEGRYEGHRINPNFEVKIVSRSFNRTTGLSSMVVTSSPINHMGASSSVVVTSNPMDQVTSTTPKSEEKESPNSGTTCPSMDIDNKVPPAISDDQTSDSMTSHGFEVTGAGAETPAPYLVPFEDGWHQADLDKYTTSLAGDKAPDFSPSVPQAQEVPEPQSGSDIEIISDSVSDGDSDFDEDETPKDLEWEFLQRKEREKKKEEMEIKKMNLEWRIRDIWPLPGRRCPHIVRFLMDYEMGTLDLPVERLPPGMSQIIGKVKEFYLILLTMF